MERMVIGRTGLEAYRLGFGALPIQRVSEKQAVETVLHAVECGIDFIDSSRVYGTSEHFIGLALKQTERKVILATKSLGRTEAAIRKDIGISLKELQRDYIDIYQCHFVNKTADYEAIIAPGGALEGLRKARAEGIIGHIGISSHNLDLLERVVDEGFFDTIMLCFSFLEHRAAEKVIPKAREKNIGVLAMKPFSGGVIENVELALKYTLAEKGVLILGGVEQKDFFDQNWKVFQAQKGLTEEDTREIERIRKIYDKVFCRRCDYCLPCTENIPIQMVMGIRSLVKRQGNDVLVGRHRETIEKGRKCSECGECETRCPYGLPIRELIKQNVSWADEQIRAIESGKG